MDSATILKMFRIQYFYNLLQNLCGDDERQCRLKHGTLISQILGFAKFVCSKVVSNNVNLPNKPFVKKIQAHSC
jgi:hypothetical protein